MIECRYALCAYKRRWAYRQLQSSSLIQEDLHGIVRSTCSVKPNTETLAVLLLVDLAAAAICFPAFCRVMSKYQHPHDGHFLRSTLKLPQRWSWSNYEPELYRTLSACYDTHLLVEHHIIYSSMWCLAWQCLLDNDVELNIHASLEVSLQRTADEKMPTLKAFASCWGELSFFWEPKPMTPMILDFPPIQWAVAELSCITFLSVIAHDLKDMYSVSGDWIQKAHLLSFECGALCQCLEKAIHFWVNCC